MKITLELIRRNTKLFFKDKGMFFTSLITPLILLLLYATFLGNVYKDSFMMSVPEGMPVSDKVVNAFVSGQLISSILAVSCVTVAFCSNMLMVQDKANGSINDLSISPVKGQTLAVSYYVASFLSTLTICFTAMAACLAYIAVVGWYMSFSDVLLLALDIILLVMFGTALSSVVNFFLSTQGQISAVGTVVSSCYGFVSGAYMPISQFSDTLQNIIAFLPGTYGTSLMRNHAMNGVFRSMEDEGFPKEIIDLTKDAIDCNIYFFDNKVNMGTMYLILIAAVAVLLCAYIVMNVMRLRGKREG